MSNPSPRPRAVRRLATLLLGLALSAAALALTESSAGANPPGPHEPRGGFSKIAAATTSAHTPAVEFRGWTADPDGLTQNLTIYGLVDGRIVNSGRTALPYASVTKKYHLGPTPGFDLVVPTPATGTHSVCVASRSIGRGVNHVIGCVATPLNKRASSSYLASRSGHGVLSAASASSSTVRVRGWAVDPDYLSKRATVVLYIDGNSAATVYTTTSSAAQRAAGAGTLGAYDISAQVARGSHVACVWVVNLGLGSNTLAGCSAVDTRGAAGHGTVTQPAANKTALATAKKMLGGRYVWGGENAKKKQFDCSGLVQYSYSTAHVSIPRIAMDQFTAARLIPLSRAVPGDLVFYHDSTGEVYHVGMYDGPADSVAAIDEQEGIAHQHIWDTTATYGSFTHS